MNDVKFKVAHPLDHLLYVMVIAAVLCAAPATVISAFWIFAMIRKLDTMGLWEGITLYTNLFLNILGFYGLVLLLWKDLYRGHHLKKLLFLSLGLLSLVVHFSFIAPGDAWRWFLLMKEPEEWWIIAIPVITALLMMVLIIRDYTRFKKVP